MTRRRLDVDMGSMILPVGEDQVAGGGPASAGAVQPLLVARFRQALREGSHPPPQAPEQGVAEEEAVSPFDLFGLPAAAQDGVPAELVTAIERLWVSHGASGVREVRMKLPSGVLTETSVRLHEAGGVLQVDLATQDEATRRRLRPALPALARDIGERLHRPVRVSLSATDTEQAEASEFDGRRTDGS